MDVLKTISYYFLRYDSLFYWRDIIEIIFFASLFYIAAIWLKKDKQKNLLPYFYSYCILALSTHYLGLTTISYTMFLFAPVTAMIFILMHQELLQRNVIALKNITPAKQIYFNWLETLIKTSLLAVNNEKKITCVIEQQDSLLDFLETPLLFNAEMKQELLDILLASQSFNQEKMIWVTTQGSLVGINANWKKQIRHDDLAISNPDITPWKQQALFFTTKTDAIVIHIDPTSRTFDIVLNGMVVDRMHATKALEFIKKYIVSKKSLKMGIQNYGKVSKKGFSQQRST